MTSERPNPDDLLQRVQREEERAGRGRLKIFFGYAAGVGKTYAMLEAARREKAEGIDVVVGYVEPHGRAETEALLEGLETLPMRMIPYESVVLREFDLDGALSRKPKLLLVDELAHTNAVGSRHAKRWQDVEELLAAGIDVWSTLNVQHLESLNDVVAQVTGIIVQETLPDEVIQRTDEIELIDLTPEELVDRLKAGKVYLPYQAERALQSFFKRANLLALRELAVRETADRLHRDVESARLGTAAAALWATRERLLVCVGPSPTSARLIRTAKRMCDRLGADWLAVAVQRPEAGSDGARQRVAKHLSLAQRLGAETKVLIGGETAATILEHARSRNVSKIIVGKSARPWWQRLLRRGLVEQLLDASGDIDVYVIRGRSEEAAPGGRDQARPAAEIDWASYAWTALIVALCGGAGVLSQSLRLAEANVAMIFLLGTVVVATRFGRGPAVAAAVANVLVFDFFFVPPYLSFSVSDAQYLITFAVMLATGVIISTLTARIRERLRATQMQERRTAALYRLTRQLSEVVGSEFLVQIAGKQLAEIFGPEVVLFIREPGRPVELRYGSATAIAKEAINAVVAQWVADHDKVAGLGTDTLPNATALFVPMSGSGRTVGAVGVRTDPDRRADPDQRRLLETCASLIALSIERDQSVLEAQQATVKAETEQLRSSLLSSVSHDLRTPLAAITGAASSLQDGDGSTEDRRELLETVIDESRRLSRLVENLLQMTRLESAGPTLNRQWHVLEEIVGSAIGLVRKELGDRKVTATLAPDLPLLFADDVLLEQVLVNLLENAARYTPVGSQVGIAAECRQGRVEIRVGDDGPGLPIGSEEQVFEKFVRGPSAAADSRRGVGLGLAICRAVVQAHGGRITARNRSEGGAEFLITLPLTEGPPAAVAEGVA